MKNKFLVLIVVVLALALIAGSSINLTRLRVKNISNVPVAMWLTSVDEGGMYYYFTLEEGITYEISGTRAGGDGVVEYVINDVGSGVEIGSPHQFVGLATPVSLGIACPTAGTGLTYVKNLRLTRIG